ncbi:hypothetical protein [Flavobacterium sp. CS20]|uniref:hypothetical protein n=1 Tax=Flavobacterium sp. CS20 TaxID=2775246 RepID=UPI001B3A4627|nr:hypothetical protein [Flavobacterium sp. CS20]QTY27753.1 hypothetical protein IGB25_04295 [Flavobacterium sp. CS20]
MRISKLLNLTLIIGLAVQLTFGQTPKIPTIEIPSVPKPTNFTPQSIFDIPKPYSPTNPMDIFQGTDEQERIKRQNEQIIREVQLNEQRQIEAQKKIYADLKMERTNFRLPSLNHIAGTEYYRKAFDKLSGMNPDDFSIKDATFIIENAFYEEQKDHEEFNQIVKQTGDFLKEKMDELGYDRNSNLAKNLILFQFFSDTLEIKQKNLKHLPFKYDFEDYWGADDWTKMFVHKLLQTGSGQCNSLPRLYLILAEEIGAEAFLALSPNHSYIKFRDEEENWYNVELTNGMFTLDSFILQSGYIKSEALTNGIYMEPLSSKQLLSQLLTDFASGYVHKFGYSPFVKEVTDKAFELYPNSLNANMMNSNFMTVQFENATHQIGVNPRDNRDLQNIRFYPPIVAMLNETNAQYRKIDDLGYEYMSAQAYQKWLDDLMDAKQQQDNETIKQQFNIKLNQLKN